MKHKAFYKEFKNRLHAQYPSVAKAHLPMPPVSPFMLTLPSPTVQKIKKLVQTLYKMAHRKSYQKLVKTDQKSYLKANLPDSSVLMSYDFHTNEQGHPKLIEVNTHASGYLVSELVDQVHFSSNKKPQPKTTLYHLKKSFEEEWQSFSGTLFPPPRTRIVDHQIPKQKMYVEFLMFKDLLNHQWHWPSRLEEISALKLSPKGFLQDSQKEKIDMIYNRSTDFYLQKWPLLKQAFLNQTCCISPQPKEYLLLADKARLIEWSSPDFLTKVGLSEEEKKQIQRAMLRTSPLQALPIEELWQNRKKLFFKPLRGYGGKAVYRGKTLSRKMFERIIKTPVIFQIAQPPPVWTDPSGIKWKYDIRAYAYRDKVQKLSARIYQGQLTGFQIPLSGFASIDLPPMD